MIVYKSTTKQFINDVETNSISNKIKEAVIRSFAWDKVRDNEENSWINSMPFMGNVIRRARLADDCGVLIEYNLPSTSLRVDFIISGKDDKGKEGFVIVELKQWKEAQKTSKSGIVHTKYFGDSLHPSYQAYSYKLFLKDFNQNVYDSSLQVSCCAYLHNYSQHSPEPLKDDFYKSIIDESPLFFKEDQTKLEEFLSKYVGGGNGEKILYQIESGNIRPSKKLINHVTGLFKGNPEFVLLDEQKLVFEVAKELAVKAKNKTVVIINGGPGTGKSVLSMNLLGHLIENRTTIFVAPNASFRNVMISKLAQVEDARRIRHLLKGSGVFYGARRNTFDVLIIDEAHRLKNENAFMYKGKNQVEDIVKAATVSIFFVDPKQMIRPDDIGTIEEIERVAALNKAEVHKLTLSAQFRCSGADGYVNWIDDVLHLQATGNFDGWQKSSFEFKIFDSPVDLLSAIKSKNEEGLDARLLAGYAWNWTSSKDGNSDGQIADVIIPEFEFKMPWNSRNMDTWAIDKDGINQIGCVHTSQGLEFDFVGVIVGPDLQYEISTGKYYTDFRSYKDKKGKARLKDDPASLNLLVRNIYRILLTRGMKGCYVFFVDKEVESYFKKRFQNTK